MAERRLVATESAQAPTRVKMCEGMCSACGASGAMFGVAARRGHALRRDRRRVVAVDQVVRDARMVGMLRELLLEDAGRLEVRGVRLVGRGLRRREVQRVEDLRLVVIRVFRRERLVGLGARSWRARSGRLAKSS